MIQAQLYSLVVCIRIQQHLMDSKQIAQSSMGDLRFSNNDSCKYCCLLDSKDIQNYPYDAERYLLSMMKGYKRHGYFSRRLD